MLLHSKSSNTINAFCLGTVVYFDQHLKAGQKNFWLFSTLFVNFRIFTVIFRSENKKKIEKQCFKLLFDIRMLPEAEGLLNVTRLHFCRKTKWKEKSPWTIDLLCSVTDEGVIIKYMNNNYIYPKLIEHQTGCNISIFFLGAMVIENSALKIRRSDPVR